MQKRRFIVSLGVLVGVGSLFAAANANAGKSNRQLIERWFQVIDAKQFDKFLELEHADLEMSVPMGPVQGSAGHVALTRGFATAFPNFKHTLTNCVESGEVIACEGVFAGDHTGPMAMPNGQTLAATNKHVEFPWAGMARIRGGKVASVHVYFDNLAFMQQLGVIPGPAQGKSASR